VGELIVFGKGKGVRLAKKGVKGGWVFAFVGGAGFVGLVFACTGAFFFLGRGAV
jgi:hypothetical protein